jgi:hypothetical protein
MLHHVPYRSADLVQPNLQIGLFERFGDMGEVGQNFGDYCGIVVVDKESGA